MIISLSMQRLQCLTSTTRSRHYNISVLPLLDPLIGRSTSTFVCKSSIPATTRCRDNTFDISSSTKIVTSQQKRTVTTRTVVTSPKIYKSIGPYSQAIIANNTMYVSGVLGMDKDAKLVEGVKGQTRQALENIKHILEAGNACLETVVKTTVLLNDINDFAAVNEVYAEYFTENQPARATYQVGKLPINAAIEIEVIALTCCV